MPTNTVLPLDARSARIAAGGGLAASVHGFPAGGGNAACGYCRNGFEPDGLDSGMTARRAASSDGGVPPGFPPEQQPNNNIHHN